jgi:hypothetical protein
MFVELLSRAGLLKTSPSGRNLYQADIQCSHLTKPNSAILSHPLQVGLGRVGPMGRNAFLFPVRFPKQDPSSRRSSPVSACRLLPQVRRGARVSGEVAIANIYPVSFYMLIFCKTIIYVFIFRILFHICS